jgi:dihydroorotate dehydrogenase
MRTGSLQLYTSFVYKGVSLPEEIKRGLLSLLAQKSYPRLTDATGVTASDWASGRLSEDNFR